MDAEKFCLALEWTGEDCPTGSEPAEEQADWIGRRIREACDLAAPRSGLGKSKRQAYWWNDIMNELRSNYNIKRRLLTRFNRRHEQRADRMARPDQGRHQQPQPQGSPNSQQQQVCGTIERERREELQAAYKEAKREFRSAINKAKLND